MGVGNEIKVIVKQGKSIIDKLKDYENDIVDLDNLEEINEELKKLYSEIHVYNRINNDESFDFFYKINSALENLFEFKENYEFSNKAMKEYNSLDLNDEKNIIEWIFKYENEFCFFEQSENVYAYLFKIKDIKENIVIDCSKYSVSYDFINKYGEHWGDIYEKYRPEEKFLDEIESHTIPYYLGFHNKHLDILEKYKKLPSGKVPESYFTNVFDIDELLNFYSKFKDIAEGEKNKKQMDKFQNMKFVKDYQVNINKLFIIYNLIGLKTKHNISKKALQAFKKLNKNNEKEILEWVIKFYEKGANIFPEGIVRVHKNLLRLEGINEDLIVNISKYVESYDFPIIQAKQWRKIFMKYRIEDSELNGTVCRDLFDYLAYQNKYIDLLEKYERLPKLKKIEK
ncbi:hypothetical protein [Polaribacter butkevichii]|uniref:Uncharacterized protein n=1 Tax=Polaribacter butkevichii TaxID=218490 RepID=A0A2P6C9P9_9FLAO|nr:hypothetical protein [Polaribacter butkevichii]PQJ69656.1 hypothetical protein BTO14_16830 [Polaribacter butkevichii]